MRDGRPESHRASRSRPEEWRQRSNILPSPVLVSLRFARDHAAAPRCVQKSDRRRNEGAPAGMNSASDRLTAMPCLSHPLQFLLVALAGWVNQQQRDVIDYLQEEKPYP